MSPTPCVVCTDCPPADGYQTCYPCKRHLDERLEHLLEYYALAENELRPGRGGDGRSGEQSIGLRVSALNLLGGHDLIGVLGTWERDWRDVFGHEMPARRAVDRVSEALALCGHDASCRCNEGEANAAPPTLDQLARRAKRVKLDRQGYKIRTQPIAATLAEIVEYLRAHLDRACRDLDATPPGHPAIDEFAREVRELHGQAKEAARIVHPPSWVVDCPADYDGGDCGRRLRVSSDLDEEVSCRQCGTNWTTRRLLLVAAADAVSAIWLDPTAASEITGVSERTLYRWAKTERIGRDHGRVNLGDIRFQMRHPGSLTRDGSG